MAKRLSVASTSAVAFLLVVVAPVAAAASSNDVYAGRVTIGTIPFSATVDTTDATTGANDEVLNGGCAAPATDASVWYEAAGTDQHLIADVSASDYSAGILVATGSPGSFDVIGCQRDRMDWYAEQGVNYTILVFDDQEDQGGNGGTLRFEISAEGNPECTVTGTDGDDILTGSSRADVICGFGGDDVLIGFGGDDILRGGSGRDALEGYGGRDTLVGGRGHDLLIGGPGFDGLDGGRGVDECYEMTGNVLKCELGRF